MTAAPKGSRFLEIVLWWNVVIHAAALVTMALCLLPGLPGGPTADVADRAAHVAASPLRWRLGWVPWHAAAFIDVVTGVALVMTPWVPRLAAWLTLAVTLCAVVPEQTGEVSWVTTGVDLAVKAAGDPDALRAYAALEASSFTLTVAYGASLYIVMALGWTWCFAAAGTWTRTLGVLSFLTWGSLSVGSVGLLLPASMRPNDLLVAASNAVGFPLLVLWLWLVLEQVLRRSRPDMAHGRLRPWRHPRGPGWWAAVCEAIANSRALRFTGEMLPVPTMRSDVRDVTYVNFLVDADRVAHLVPDGCDLQRLGDGGTLALVSCLIFRHGHLGPEFLGPLRRLFPSPVQCNWRIYVRDRGTGKQGVYFFTNAMDSLVMSLAARLFSEGNPMHFDGPMTADASGASAARGEGNGPDVSVTLTPGDAVLPESWRGVWPTYRALLDYAVPQDRAFSAQPWYDRISHVEVTLSHGVGDCEPMTGVVTGKTVEEVAGGTGAVCFRVAGLVLRVVGEKVYPIG